MNVIRLVAAQANRDIIFVLAAYPSPVHLIIVNVPTRPGELGLKDELLGQPRDWYCTFYRRHIVFLKHNKLLVVVLTLIVIVCHVATYVICLMK